jgi:glutathione S-transferase
MYHYTALITLLAALTYAFISTQVSRARVKYGVKLPATTGDPDFERIHRVHMNTLEWLPIFLPSLWLFAIYISDAGAAGAGLVWIIGRILYMIGYSRSVPQRGPGFAIQTIATAVLLLGSLGAVLWRIVHG